MFVKAILWNISKIEKLKIWRTESLTTERIVVVNRLTINFDSLNEMYTFSIFFVFFLGFSKSELFRQKNWIYFSVNTELYI